MSVHPGRFRVDMQSASQDLGGAAMKAEKWIEKRISSDAAGRREFWAGKGMRRGGKPRCGTASHGAAQSKRKGDLAATVRARTKAVPRRASEPEGVSLVPRVHLTDCGKIQKSANCQRTQRGLETRERSQAHDRFGRPCKVLELRLLLLSPLQLRKLATTKRRKTI